MTLEKEARDRHELHRGHPTHRPLSSDYELVGLAGEAVFAELYGLERDRERRPDGDDGKDFSFNGWLVDVKTARKAYYLLVEVGHLGQADLYVLMSYAEEAEEAARPVGWTTREELVLREPRDIGGMGVLSYWVPRADLYVESLKNYVTEKDPLDRPIGGPR